jgi:hypothetical protein
MPSINDTLMSPVTALFFIIITPIFTWAFSISLTGNNHNLPPQNAEPLLDDENASAYLINIYNWKKDIQRTSFEITTLGIVYLIMTEYSYKLTTL